MTKVGRLQSPMGVENRLIAPSRSPTGHGNRNPYDVCRRYGVMNKAHELRPAKRMARLGTETAFEVLVKARALEAKGHDIIHLEIGEPDFDTPANIIDAACDALHKSFTHYGPSDGLHQLREVIAQHVSETRGIDVTPEEVVIVPGGKPIIFFSILALVEEGDEI